MSNESQNELMLALARSIVREMHEDHFDSRRGVGVVDDDVLYFYDNNPYADPERRPREHAELHAALLRVGAERVATASYPTDGEDAGYSIVHIYECSDLTAAEECVHETWPGILMRALNELPEFEDEVPAPTPVDPEKRVSPLN